MQALQVRLFGSGIRAALYTRTRIPRLPETDRGVRECRTMDDDRRKTLQALIDIAMADDPVPCYYGSMAERLLKSQSTREELSEIGVDPTILERLWPTHE